MEERRKEREIDKKILVLSNEDLKDKVSSCRKILSGRELSVHTFKDRPEEKDKIIKNLKKLSIELDANVVVVMKMEINAINYNLSSCMFN